MDEIFGPPTGSMVIEPLPEYNPSLSEKLPPGGENGVVLLGADSAASAWQESYEYNPWQESYEYNPVAVVAVNDVPSPPTGSMEIEVLPINNPSLSEELPLGDAGAVAFEY